MNTQSFDVGTYTCHAENFIGIDKSSGILTINGKYVCMHTPVWLLDLWELCSKFVSLFYSKFLLKSLQYVLFILMIHFIIIFHLQVNY